MWASNDFRVRTVPWFGDPWVGRLTSPACRKMNINILSLGMEHSLASRHRDYTLESTHIQIAFVQSSHVFRGYSVVLVKAT